MNELIKDMFDLQNKLNIETNGEQWVNGITNKGKVINWERAITLELAECIDSFPWKHWKSISQQPDIQNAKIELVDIWHFLMSSFIETQKLYTEIETTLPESNESLVKDIKKRTDLFLENGEINYDLISLTFNKFNDIYEGFSFVSKEWTTETHSSINNILEMLEEAIVVSTLLNKYKFAYKHEPEIDHILNIFDSSERLLIAFVLSCAVLNLTFEDLRKLYMGKNVLNQFRQNNGYKEGTYIKVWNGSEDNVIMQEILEKNSDLNFKSLYNELNNVYKNLKKGE